MTLNVWSISTTVRNPERIPDFCLAVGAISGKPWNKTSQVEFMYELIRRRFYEPSKMSDDQQEAFDNPELNMSTSEARDIFISQKYKDPPMRGRTAIAPLRDIGVVRLGEEVEMTDLGSSLVNGEISLQDVLLNYFLKWELPTPEHRTFNESNGFNIRPFAGSLALIAQVNKLWAENGFEAVGISREEFEIFAPTLIDYLDINKFAKRIIDMRLNAREKGSAAAKLAAIEGGINHHLKSRGADLSTPTDRNNLRDFGDNAIRYFRQTGFIEYRGAGRYVDIAPASIPQVEMLIDSECYKPVGFADVDSYYAYISDLNSFTPPWSGEKQLGKVKRHLRSVLKGEGVVVDVDVVEAGTVNKVRGEDAEIVALRKALVTTRLGKLKSESRQRDYLDGLVLEYERLLGKSYGGYLPKPVALEFNTFKTFLSLNDAMSVTANYPMGDDGEPISTAPGGATDLLCEYKDFVLSVEVTLSRGNTQWVMEGQPVQRHLRKIEEEYSKTAYALFLAPRLHADTIETFWIANVHGYQGNKQRIAAMELPTWCQFLNTKKDDLEAAKFNQNDLRHFLDSSLPDLSLHTNSVDWKQSVNSVEFVMGFK